MHRARQDTKPRYLVAILLIMFVLRWWLGTLPGYPHDIGAFKRWALRGGTQGIHTLYDEGSLYDYPPLYGYLLAPCGYLFARGNPEYATAYLARDPAHPVGYSALFSLLVKMPPLIFDILLALLMAILVRRWGLWGSRRSYLGWAPALIYLFHPATLFLSGYWGQPDAVETFFIMAALTLILLRKPELGWMAAALGLLMKPLAAPFFPLLALATLLRSGWWRLITGCLAGLALGLAGFIPFIVTGRGSMVLSGLLTDIDLMPYTSVNAHNLWWLFGSWQSADKSLLGPLTPKILGLSLFGAAYLTILWTVWRMERGCAAALACSTVSVDEAKQVSHSQSTSKGIANSLASGAHWYLAAAVIGFSFFTLSTHMHENHLFPVLPFLILIAGRDRRWAWLMGIAGLSMLVNMVNHDLLIGQKFLATAGGASGFFHPDLQRPLSRVEYILAYGNAGVTVATLGLLLLAFVRTARRRGQATDV